ncbi:hypothetical protein D3C73_861300 [compost metagenome]
MFYANVKMIVPLISLAMDMPMHIHVRHMLVHVHRFMGEKEEIFIDDRVFADFVKSRFQPPAPPTAAVMIA